MVLERRSGRPKADYKIHTFEQPGVSPQAKAIHGWDASTRMWSGSTGSFEQHGTSNFRASIAIAALCLLLFVDVEIPIIGSSNRLVAILVLPLLITGDLRIRMPFCIAGMFLLPFYYLLSPLFRPELESQGFEMILVYSMVSLAAMMLMAELIANTTHRERLSDAVIVVALASSIIALLQRYGLVDALGRDRWGYAVAADQSLRGAGLLADPNFLATILAAIIPLAINWRYKKLRWPSVAIIAVGINATDSRAGIILAFLGLLLAIALRGGSRQYVTKSFLARVSAVLAVVAIALVALNASGQRDRVVTGVLIGIGMRDLAGQSTDPSAEMSAQNRREAVIQWAELGMESLPFGAGVRAESQIETRATSGIAAHNSFVSAFGQGGIVGILINALTLAAVIVLIKRRENPLAIMGIIVAAGGLFLSYPGSPFLLLPLGLADGLRSAARAQ